ncbi:MAG: PVC-type heme-binding CxxCH protein, partial [Planctomycetaceae bacterium]
MNTNIPRGAGFGYGPLLGCLACTVLLVCSQPLAVQAATDRDKPQPDQVARPNFVVIFCDNLGYGDIEPFGSTVHRTPHLNRMAAEGRKFTHFYVSAGVCTPSRASLMTGCYAQRLGMHNNPRDGHVLRPISPFGLHPDEVTIAEVLQRQGYATGIFGKWHLGDQSRFLPTRQGFDTFFGIPYSDDMTRAVGQRVGKRMDGIRWPELPLMRDETVIEAPVDRDLLTQRCTEQALAFIEANRTEPFLLYFPQPMPGSTAAPFASPAFQGRSRNGPWGDAIEEIDWSTGQILDKLEELGLDDRTLVVWMSDNGAPMTGDPTRVSRGTNRPLHGRGYTTSEGAFRSPTIMRWPGKIPAGTVCAEMATTMDLLPTCARLAGIPIDEQRLDGRDVSSLILDESGAKTPHDRFFFYDRDQLQAVRQGPWKLFLPLKSFGRHPHFRKGESTHSLLFNVVEDIACSTDVAADHPQVVARLTELAQAAREDLGDRGQQGRGQRKPGRLAGKQPQPQVLKRDALQMIEGVRGGRHWVDAKTAAPKSPQDSLECLQIEPGLQVQLVAAEPLVRDPVAIAFDHLGRMFVVEYGDYPIGPPEGDAPLSRVVMLEDRDHDGRMDRRHVFADKLKFAHSLMAFNGGLLVGAQTQILFLQDTNGDHVADVRQVMFDGFQPAHPQMQIGNPRWGLDNWIYLNYGPGKIASSKNPKQPVSMPRKDFRFDPRTLEFEADSGLGQFGNTIDRWGHRFYCTNRNPIMTTLLPPAVQRRNPFAVIATAHYDVGRSGGDTRVYPLVEMKSNYLSHAGTHTSACGVTAYLGDLLGSAYHNSVFVCEPIGHLVTRSIVEPQGLRLVARRARPKADFLASSDTWFRPASLATGPNGALYLADMYRLWVEHPKFLPPEIAAKLDWRAGEDRGRIYRIVPGDGAGRATQPRPLDVPRSTAKDATRKTVGLLDDSNGWRQFLGQRLLVERQDKNAAGRLRELLQHSQRATTRLHALWTLDGLDALESADARRALDDVDPHLRRDAVKLSARWLDEQTVFDKLIACASDADTRVRFQVALTLAGSPRSEVTDVLIALALRDGADSWFANGLLTSAETRSGAILAGLISDQTFVKTGQSGQAQLVKRLAAIVGMRGDQDELKSVLELLTRERPEGLWWRAAMISGLGQGLPRFRGGLGRVSLPKLLSDPPAGLGDAAKRLRSLLEQNQAAALDASRSVADRSAAVELLAYQPFATAAPAFEKLLQTGQPVQVQTACINALSANGSAEAAEIVLRRWPELGPLVRGPALNLLLRRTSSTRQALDAMA